MTAKTYSPEAIALADAILKASGSNIKNYTMQSSRDAILGAAQAGIDAARAELLPAMRNLLLDAPYPNWAFYSPKEAPAGDDAENREKYSVSLNTARNVYRKVSGSHE